MNEKIFNNDFLNNAEITVDPACETSESLTQTRPNIAPEETDPKKPTIKDTTAPSLDEWITRPEP